MSDEHEITITVSEEQMEILRQFEDITGTPPRKCVKEAAQGGIKRAEEFVFEVDM